MSPLIRRKVVHETLIGKRSTVAVFYVDPSKVQPGDVVVEPSEKQLAELRKSHPEEFQVAAAKPRAAPPVDPPAVTPAPTDPPADPPAPLTTEQLTELAFQFTELEWQKAVSAVETENDEEVLKILFAAEQTRERPRPSVLEAFAARGLVVAPPAPPAE